MSTVEEMLTNTELRAEIADAEAAVTAASRLTLLKAEQQRRTDQREAAVAERDSLLARLTQQLAACEQQHRADLAALAKTPQSDAYPAIERAYVSGRQAYSFAHELYGVTGNRVAHYRGYGVPDALRLHGGAQAEAFLLSIRGKPPHIDQPWRADVARLRELTPPRVEMSSLT